jgi:hypothetical protein
LNSKHFNICTLSSYQANHQDGKRHDSTLSSYQLSTIKMENAMILPKEEHPQGPEIDWNESVTISK